MAHTNHIIKTVLPSTYKQLSSYDGIEKRYSVIFGKKRINLQNGSGIYDATCGRMYVEYYITLPGGFRLPVSLAVESIVYRTGAVMELSKTAAEQMLASFSQEYISHQMIAGTVLSEISSIQKIGDVWVRDSSFMCSEMIGRIAAEGNGVLHE